MLDNIKDQGTKLGKTLRAYPVAITVVGIECGWLAISVTGAGEGLRKQASDAGRHARAWSEQFREQIKGMAARARSATARAPYPTEPGGYAHAREKMSQSMTQAGDKMPSADTALQDLAPAAQGAGVVPGVSDADGRVNEWLSGPQRVVKVLARHPFAIFVFALATGAAIKVASPVLRGEQDGHGPD